MKKNLIRHLIPLAFLFLMLPACAPSAAVAPTPVSLAGEYLATDYDDAANLRNQLAFGILKLDGTTVAVSREQAVALIPLWQAVIALSADTTSAEEELTAVQDQIAQTLNAEQLQAIAAMRLTNADLNAFYAENGVSLPTPVPGVTRVPGQNSSLSQADKEATKTAAQALGTPVGVGNGQTAKTLLFEKVIAYLSAVAGK